MNGDRTRAPILRLATRLAAVCLLGAAGHALADTPREWEFAVSLDGRDIGRHSFSVAEQGGPLRMTTEARFDVRILFVTAFRYRHTSTEIWQDGCLAGIDAETDSNGDRLAVRGRLTDTGLRVSGSAGDGEFDDCVLTFAYWNPAILEADRLLNSQTGEYEDVAVRFEGQDAVVVGGRPVDALRYRLSAGRGDITLWYRADETRTWLALEAPAKGGRTLRYRPVTVPGDDAGGVRVARGQ